MNHIQLYEGFLTLPEFKDIKPGSLVNYMGGVYSVEENDGNILTLSNVDEEDEKMEVNYNMFKQKGRYIGNPEEELDESSNPKEIILTSRQNRDITITVLGGHIETIDNKSGVNFPYKIGQYYNRSIETWACNNGFKVDGKDPCQEEKVFGIRTKDIPQGHELRMLFPHKFRK